METISEGLLYTLSKTLRGNLPFGIESRLEIMYAFAERPIFVLENTSLSSHFKGYLSHICYLIPILLMTFFIPVRLGHYLFPFTGRLVLRCPIITEHEQPPNIEYLICQVISPIIMDRMRYLDNAKTVFDFFFKKLCRVLDLNDYLKATGTGPFTFIFTHTNLSCMHLSFLIFYFVIYFFISTNFFYFTVASFFVFIFRSTVSQLSYFYLIPEPRGK